MTKMEHGATTWDKDAGNGGNKNSKDVWLRLNPGSNVIRLATNPYVYYIHKYKVSPNEKGFGHRVYCSQIHGRCPVCEKGGKENQPKKRWLVGVIDRKTNTYKVLDIGFSVYKDIQTYNKDADWGDPKNYDLDIVVSPNAGPMGFYKTVAKPSKPLSASDQKILDDQLDEEYLEKRTQPATIEAVETRLQKLNEEFGGGVAEMKSSVATSNSTDDDTDFPDYDAG